MILIVRTVSSFLIPEKSALIKSYPSVFNLFSVLSTEESRNVSDKQIISYYLHVAMAFNNETFEKLWPLILFKLQRQKEISIDFSGPVLRSISP